MIKNLLILSLYFSICLSSLAQTKDSIKMYLSELQRIAFVTDDSIYEYTLYIEPNGGFYFREGFIDSTHMEGRTVYSLDKHEISEKYNLQFRYISEFVDTICNYFPAEIHTNTESEPIISRAKKLEASYVLKQLEEIKLIDSRQEMIRLLFPCESLNNCNYYYVFSIQFNKEGAKAYVIAGQSIDYSGIQLTKRDSVNLKQRDVKRIRKYFNSLSSDNVECIESGNPWIFEFREESRYNYSIISSYCKRKEKVLRTREKTYFLIINICLKYFKINC